MAKAGRIRVGIGGWTYEPWRETFYPQDLAQKRELEYASRQVTAIEINGTFYRTQKPETFRNWREETPDDFIFSVKAPRYATNRKILAEAGVSIERFMESGLTELGNKLGPILWQFAPTKRFERDDFAAFLELLPSDAGGRSLRHVLDVRHESFMHPDFVALMRRYGMATVFTDSEDYPSFADVSANFLYARLMRADASIETGYDEVALDAWAKRARSWAEGGEPADLPRLTDEGAKRTPRDVFVYMINGAKERAPAAARRLLSLLGEAPVAQFAK
jgi:uncharacterized protein YecE (DUF72 family)